MLIDMLLLDVAIFCYLWPSGCLPCYLWLSDCLTALLACCLAVLLSGCYLAIWLSGCLAVSICLAILLSTLSALCTPDVLLSAVHCPLCALCTIALCTTALWSPAVCLPCVPFSLLNECFTQRTWQREPCGSGGAALVAWPALDLLLPALKKTTKTHHGSAHAGAQHHQHEHSEGSQEVIHGSPYSWRLQLSKTADRSHLFITDRSTRSECGAPPPLHGMHHPRASRRLPAITILHPTSPQLRFQYCTPPRSLDRIIYKRYSSFYDLHQKVTQSLVTMCYAFVIARHACALPSSWRRSSM